MKNITQLHLSFLSFLPFLVFKSYFFTQNICFRFLYSGPSKQVLLKENFLSCLSLYGMIPPWRRGTKLPPLPQFLKSLGFKWQQIPCSQSPRIRQSLSKCWPSAISSPPIPSLHPFPASYVLSLYFDGSFTCPSAPSWLRAWGQLSIQEPMTTVSNPLTTYWVATGHPVLLQALETQRYLKAKVCMFTRLASQGAET